MAPISRTSSLKRHIFVRVALPVGIVFLSCFSIMARLTQNYMAGHLRQELSSGDAQAQKFQDREARRLAQTLPAAAEAAGIALAGAGGIRPEQLKVLDGLLAMDLYAFVDERGNALWAVQREGSLLRPVEGVGQLQPQQSLSAAGGRYYFLNSLPLSRAGGAKGWLVAGRLWRSGLPEGQGEYLLVSEGKIVDSSERFAKAGFPAGAAWPGCNVASTCEMNANGGRMMMARSGLATPGGGPAIYLVRSFDLLAGPLLGMTQTVMVAGSLLSILAALGLALLVERGISGPLRDITKSCLRAQATQQLSDIQIVPSRISEVNTLGQTLKAAIRTIDEGQSQLTQAYFQFMGAIVALLDARDAYTAGHSHRVSAYAEALARDFGLPKEQVDDIRVGALLHDIGKIGVPDEVLRKHERLTKEEFDLMKQHPTIGRNVLEQIVQFEKYLDIVELHHENLDGTGYPRGLRGEAIPIAARIVKVADVYDALSTDRPYRKKMAREQVHAILRNGSGAHFDRLLVEIFLTRSVPRFENHSSLQQLSLAVGESRPLPMKARTAPTV